MTAIGKVLVANRGEIALRVMRTCRDMGIASVAVFSDADAGAAFVRAADEAVRIGPAASRESYLAIDRIVEAARRSGADAVHPGYGFLAENAEFAEACAAAGLTFIGPTAEVIRLLGSKRESKRVVAEAGVPVIPGYSGADQETATLRAMAREIGFPVLIKASAGGGGKGMRVVRAAGDLDEAIESARREALSSFADGTLLVERYLDRPRHVEFQILGDAHGNLVHLFERECSIQRRHQKIVEESPSPAVDAELRARMGAAAVTVGRAVGYRNAGTVELILGADRSFYFLEVNTRLQVEHPVTEMVTGVDLVREQIRIAEGAPLSFTQEELAQRGHAIEVRLYAEDPDAGFLPTTGRLLDWQSPAGLRVDTGVEAGQEIGIHYDPMLAKVIAHAATRTEAARALAGGLRTLWAPGLVTNRDYLVRVLEHPAFLAGDLDTHFVDHHAAELAAPALPAEELAAAAIAAALYAAERRRTERTVLPALEPGYRNNRFSDERVVFEMGPPTLPSSRERGEGEELTVRYRNLGGRRYQVHAGPVTGEVRVADVDAGGIALEIDARRRQFRVACDGPRLFVQSPAAALTLVEQARFPERRADAVAGALAAPMPGKVVKVLVAIGQVVRAGDTLLVLEAMKMEHTVRAPEAGVVEHLAVAEGDQVVAAALLVVVTPAG